MTQENKGRSDGLHKQYFNGTPEHSGNKPTPSPKAPTPNQTPRPKGH